ncbi:MAG: hypothetical protein ACE145_00905 [Terriglobia bacterium]
MLEAIVIIVALGGLELILWCLGHRQQKRQLELLDSIWAELAIRNSMIEDAQPGGLKGERRSEPVTHLFGGY